MVGSWDGADGVRHGYVLREGKFTDFDPPNSVSHEPHSINEDGQIVGFFQTADDRFHGYLLTEDKDDGGDDRER